MLLQVDLLLSGILKTLSSIGIKSHDWVAVGFSVYEGRRCRVAQLVGRRVGSARCRVRTPTSIDTALAFDVSNGHAGGRIVFD